MTDSQIMDLIGDVADLLRSLQCELSRITTSDTGNDPTWHIRDGIAELRVKLADLKSPQAGSASTLAPQQKGEV